METSFTPLLKSEQRDEEEEGKKNGDQPTLYLYHGAAILFTLQFSNTSAASSDTQLVNFCSQMHVYAVTLEIDRVTCKLAARLKLLLSFHSTEFHFAEFFVESSIH